MNCSLFVCIIKDYFSKGSSFFCLGSSGVFGGQHRGSFGFLEVSNFRMSLIRRILLCLQPFFHTF